MLTDAGEPNISPERSHKMSSQVAQNVSAKKAARTTTDMTSPFGGLSETAVPDISIVLASKNPHARPIQLVDDDGIMAGWDFAVYRSSPDQKGPGLRIPSSDDLRAKRKWDGW
jgi:hypothetical protein